MKRSIAVLEAEARSSRSKAASTGTTPRRTRTWPWASSARYKRTAALVKDLKAVLEEYGVTGHSLRGTLAQHVHDNVLEKMGRLVAFNPGATLLGPIPGRDGRIYSTRGDVVSALSYATHKDVRERADLAGRPRGEQLHRYVGRDIYFGLPLYV